MFKRSIIAAVFAIAPLTAAFATTTVVGAVTKFNTHSDDGTYDSKPCVVVIIGGSTTLSGTTGVYAFSTSDPGYQDEFSVLLLSYLTGQSVTLTDTGATLSTCGSNERGVDAQLGS